MGFVEISDSVQRDQLIDILDKTQINLFFFEKKPNAMNNDEKNEVANILALEENNDIQFVVRSVTESVAPPYRQAFPKNLHLQQRPLIYHEEELDLN